MDLENDRRGEGRFTRSAALFACAVCLLGGATPAQERSLDAGGLPPQESNQKTMVFPLKYAKAEAVASVLQQLYSRRGITAVAHQPTNSVLVQAPPNAFEGLQGVLKDLDAKATDTAELATAEDELQTRIFRLKAVRLDKDLQNVLRQVLPGKVALDSERNLVVVQGTPKALQLAESILADIDQGGGREVALGKPPQEVWQVRVVWLIGGVSSRNVPLPPPPPDLKAVSDELARVGIDELAMVSQTFVVALTDQQFSVTYYPQLSPQEEGPCDVQLTGSISERQDGRPQLRLTLSASQKLQKPLQPGPPIPPRNLCQLQTTVITPPGHPAVLCVTPVGEMTSVFVVQLSPK